MRYRRGFLHGVIGVVVVRSKDIARLSDKWSDICCAACRAVRAEKETAQPPVHVGFKLKVLFTLQLGRSGFLFEKSNRGLEPVVKAAGGRKARTAEFVH